MGKASKTKKHRNKLAEASAPLVTYQGKEVDTKSLYSDLESIYENKRRDGCELLIGIVSSCNADVLSHLATPQLLNILSLRLLDTSPVVRGYTAQIISSLAVCKNSAVANKIVSSGCYHAMLTLFAEQIRGVSLRDTPDMAFLEALLEAISNIGAASEAAIVMAAQEHFLTLLIEQLHLRLQQGPLSLCSAIALLLYTYTDAPLAALTSLSASVFSLAASVTSIPISPPALPILFYILGTCINLYSTSDSIAASTIANLFQPLHTYMESSKDIWTALPQLCASMAASRSEEDNNCISEIPADMTASINIVELYLEITSNLLSAINQAEKGVKRGENCTSSSDEDEPEHNTIPTMANPLRAALPSTSDIYSYPHLLQPSLETLSAAAANTAEKAEFSLAGSAVASLAEHIAIALTNSYVINRDLSESTTTSLLSALLAMYRNLHQLFLTHDEVPLRGAAIAAASNIASLHRIVHWNANVTDIDIHNHRIAAIVMAISSFPWVEVPQAFCDVLSCLVGSNLVTIVQAQEISLAILLRLSNPSCLTLSPSCQYEGSLLLMECLLSVVIDLHSSDDTELYQVYQQLQMAQHLSTALRNFTSKIKKEGKLLHRRDLMRCKETLENLEMFIHYKQATPSCS